MREIQDSAMLFERCPLGCPPPLENTDIVLPEGALRRCNHCGQLLSACTRAWYDASMQEFDQPEGTLPSGKSAVRYAGRMGAILNKAATMAGNTPAGMQLLDVGCSSGALLRVAADIGFTVRGVEPAAKAADTARGMGFDVFPGLLQEAGFDADSFDIVTLFEVIEHLLDPIEVVTEIARILKPGGLLVIGTGNADSWTVQALGAKWEYFDIRSHGGHISFYTPASMRLLADKTGLEVTAIETKRVNLGERRDLSPLMYQFNRVARELLALPARWSGKGHDMLVILRKRG